MQFLLDNIALVGLILVSGGILVWPLVTKLIGGQREVGTLEATRLINSNALVLDIREGQEYAAGHLPHSRNIPLGQLASRIGELAKYKDKPIIVVCRTGMRSANACRILKKNEFTQVYPLKGGIGAWEQAGLPLERKK